MDSKATIEFLLGEVTFFAALVVACCRVLDFLIGIKGQARLKSIAEHYWRVLERKPWGGLLLANANLISLRLEENDGWRLLVFLISFIWTVFSTAIIAGGFLVIVKFDASFYQTASFFILSLILGMLLGGYCFKILVDLDWSQDAKIVRGLMSFMAPFLGVMFGCLTLLLILIFSIVVISMSIGAGPIAFLLVLLLIFFLLDVIAAFIVAGSMKRIAASNSSLGMLGRVSLASFYSLLIFLIGYFLILHWSGLSFSPSFLSELTSQRLFALINTATSLVPFAVFLLLVGVSSLILSLDKIIRLPSALVLQRYYEDEKLNLYRLSLVAVAVTKLAEGIFLYSRSGA